jgi:broad specificity phosphatase PhoE
LTTFFLIRHAECRGLGQTLWGRTQGICLNDKGKLQAQGLAERFAEVKLEAIYSSPLERALETAEAIARVKNLEVKNNEAFNEINFGEWTEKTFDNLATDTVWRSFNAHRSDTQIPGGESFLEVQARVVKELERLSEDHNSARVAIVSHADVIKAAVAHFAGIPIDLIDRIEISLCSVTAVAFDNEFARLLTINSRWEPLHLWAE